MRSTNKILCAVASIFVFVLAASVFVLLTSPTRDQGADSPVLLLKNYNDEGGFFWQMYNVLNMLWAAEKYHATPVVLFDSGLYFEKRQRFRKQIVNFDPHNWFNHFFQPINSSGRSDKHWNMVLWTRLNVPRFKISSGKLPKVSLFDRSSLESVSRKKNRTQHFGRLWKKYVHPRSHILRKIDAFKQRHLWPQHSVRVGIHYRGTDKFPSSSGSEDDPVHYPYSFCAMLIQEILVERANPSNFIIFVASDEAPFVKHMESAFPGKVCFTDSIRSGVSTSGVLMDTSECSQGVMKNAVCRRYNSLIDESIHRGMKNVSKYQKGEDVLMDVLLLSACDVFLRSRGNVSNFVEYLNPQAETIDMVDRFQHQK